jgi:hypothetical protein
VREIKGKVFLESDESFVVDDFEIQRQRQNVALEMLLLGGEDEETLRRRKQIAQKEVSLELIIKDFNGQVHASEKIRVLGNAEGKIRFGKKKAFKKPGWDKSYGLTGYLSNCTQTFIKVSLIKQCRVIWNNWDGISIFLMRASMSPDAFRENCEKTYAQEADYPYYGVHPYKPDHYNLKIIKKYKQTLKRNQPIFIKFDPIKKRVVFHSEQFIMKSERIEVHPNERFYLAVYMQYHSQVV